MTFIYGLTDPRNDRVRYVGKTSQPLKERFSQHIITSRKGKTHKERWIQALVSKELLPGMVVLEECADDGWQDREVFWIAKYGDQLTNIAPGGAGYAHTPETVVAITGERSKVAKLKGAQVSEIKTMILSCLYSALEIARRYDVTPSTVRKIGKEETWKTVEPRITWAEYEKSKKSAQHRGHLRARERGLTLAGAARILELVAEGFEYKDVVAMIFDEFKSQGVCTVGTVSCIVCGFTWPDAIEGCSDNVRNIIAGIRKERGWNSKATASQASEIKTKILSCLYSGTEIARQYGVSLAHVSRIGTGQRWKDVEPRISTEAYEKSKKAASRRTHVYKLTLNSAVRVLEIAATGVQYKHVVATIFDELQVQITMTTACQIVRGKTWPDAIDRCSKEVRDIINDIRSKSAGENRIRTAAARKAKNALRQL